VEKNEKKMIRRAINLKGFMNVVRKPAILITERVKKDNILGIPVLKREKLEEIETKEEVIEIAEESL
jgi:predicted transcriptional regulator